jgi:hypothetical protein
VENVMFLKARESYISQRAARYCLDEKNKSNNTTSKQFNSSIYLTIDQAIKIYRPRSTSQPTNLFNITMSTTKTIAFLGATGGCTNSCLAHLCYQKLATKLLLWHVRPKS